MAVWWLNQCPSCGGGSTSTASAAFTIAADEANRLAQSSVSLGHRTLQTDTGVIWTLIDTPASAVSSWQANASGTPSPRQGNAATIASLPVDDSGLDRILVASNLLWYRWNGSSWVPESLISSGTSAQRTALTEQVSNQVFFQTSDDTEWTWNGTAWVQETLPKQTRVSNIGALPANANQFDRVFVETNRLFYQRNQGNTAWEVEDLITYVDSLSTLSSISQQVQFQVVYVANDGDLWRWTTGNGWAKILD